LAFFEEDPDRAPGGGAARRPPPDPQRQIFVRRVAALGIGVLILILLLLGVRGCLDARKTRGFENYASDLDSIVTTANQLSSEFFTRLLNPPENADALALEADIAADRGTAQGLLSRVEGLDTPDEIAGAQEDLETAFDLRLDALGGISEQIPTALGQEGRSEAIEAIVTHMRELLASDVLYASAREAILAVFQEEEIEARVQESIFMPAPVERWLDDEQLAAILGAFATATEQCSGTHGVEISSVVADGTPLIAGSENTLELGNRVAIDVEVLNGGEANETDVEVSAELAGPTGVLEAESVIPRIDVGELGDATVTFEDPPPTDVPLALEVTAIQVPCETILDNNTLTYTVTFE
jgi:hypothetical protein